MTASFRPVERIALVTELRAEGDTNGGPWTALPFAAYVRVRPWKDRPFDIQAGRIPPVFGAAGRRIYANDNVLIGYPAGVAIPDGAAQRRRAVERRRADLRAVGRVASRRIPSARRATRAACR